MKPPTHLYVDRASERQSATRRPPRREGPAAVGDATGLLGSLQRSAGNQAVRSLLDRYAVQRAAEEEEDKAQAKHEASALQRAAEEEDEKVQAKHEGVAVQRAEEDEEKVQAKAEVGLEGGPLSSELAGRIQARRGSGTPLEAGTRTRMETAFGTNFTDVGVHTDGEADQLNRSISAVAFTTGSDVFFRQGAYEPATPAGRQLLAHELTHVVQQRGMSGAGPMRVGPADDGYERQADATAATVSRAVESGESAALPSVTMAQDGVQLQRLVATSAIFRATELQRDDDTPDAADASGGQPAPAAASATTDEPIDSQVELPVPEVIAVPADQLPAQPGDYELPADSGVAMAKHVQRAGAIQRDDDTPHPSADAQNQGTVTLAGPTQAPWSLQVTAIYRNLNIAQIKSLHLDLGHEPQASLSVDSTGGMSTQFAYTLINWHYMPSWNREIEVGLSALANYTLVPKLSSLYGTQLQVEQHIVPWFSVTVNATGYWIPPQGGQPGQFGASAGLGGLIHFDGL